MKTTELSSQGRLPRRRVLQWMAAATTLETGGIAALAQQNIPAAASAATGYGTDPNLATTYQPGDFWPLTLADSQRAAGTALADVILPADEHGPAASDLRIIDYVDEWISAPYPRQENDRRVILPGLDWLDAESQESFGKPFADVSSDQKKSLCDTLADPPVGDANMQKQSAFFHRFATVASGAYFSTPEGWKAIGYIGNQASGIFAGPPEEVLDQLGLEQTVQD